MDGSENANEAATGNTAAGPGRRFRWTKTLKEQFLDHLATTCHVAGAAEAIGVDATTIYGLRRRDPAFRAAWSEALALGYEMLETRVVGHALSGGGETISDGGVEIAVELALKLLTIHRKAMLGKSPKYRLKPQTATREESNAAILRQLSVVEEGMRRAAARTAASGGGADEDGRAGGRAVALLPRPAATPADQATA